MSARRSLSAGVVIGLFLALIFLGGFLAGTIVTRQQDGAIASAGSDSDLKDFLTAYHLVLQRSYYRPFNKHRLIYAAIDGMLSATGDPHTLFFSPHATVSANQQLNGTQFSGIGAIVAPSHGLLQIVAPLPGTPATQSGLRAGDLVTKINGRPVAGMSGDEAIARIHGRTGTVVRLTVLRSHHHPFVIKVKRAQIPPITAYGKMLPHHIGYIQIFSFGDTTGREVAQALSTVQHQGARALILDLRENPGGYVDAAQQVVSQFLHRGIVAYEESTSHHLAPLGVVSGQKVVSLPLVVLVDAGTASAAEITAAGLRDNGRAVLIGTRTYGKGSMQSVYALPDGSTLRITDRLWLTPDKHTIQTVGIKPNIQINDTPQAAARGRDLQLLRAERYLEQHNRT